MADKSDRQLSGQGVATDAGLREFINRELLPLLIQWRSAYNESNGPTVDIASISGETVTVLVGPSAQTYLCDDDVGDITLTLPPALGATMPYTFKQVDGGNDVTIARSGTDTLDGAASIVMSATNSFRTVVSNGVDKWFVVADG